jgi:hypothetical protein
MSLELHLFWVDVKVFLTYSQGCSGAEVDRAEEVFQPEPLERNDFSVASSELTGAVLLQKVGCFFVIPVIVILSAGPALAWEATRSGPILGKDRIDEIVKGLAQTPAPAPAPKPHVTAAPPKKPKYHPGKTGKSAGGHPKAAPAASLKPAAESGGRGSGPLLNRRTVEYPQQSGARLADGWDFITNTRIYSQCINFGTAARDGFQQARMDYKQVVDTETFFASLNVNTSANFGGSYGIVSGRVDGAFNVETSYRVVSKDDVIVAHASVVNGASYVTAQTEQNPGQTPPEGDSAKLANLVNPPTKDSIAGVKLSVGALKLLKEGGREMFRTACGDGFIAAIGTGADLYVLYHFSELEREKKLKLYTMMKANGGWAGFTAGGSMDATLVLNDLIKNTTLGISYIQNGGKIEALPTKADDVPTRVAALPKEAFAGGRPLYVIVVPYNELYNWPYNFEPTELIELRTTLIRYLRRIRSAFGELQTIIADFRMNRGNPGEAKYMHDSIHRLRAMNYAELNDELKDQIELVENAIRTLDAHCVNKAETRPSTPCGDAMKPFLSKIDTDDFRFLVRLPVPRQNILNADFAKQLETREGDLDDRKYIYSMQLYGHWIERISSERCALFAECLNQAKRIDIYNKIKSSLKM